MDRLYKIFTVLTVAVSFVLAKDAAAAVVVPSKTYVDSGFAQKASASIVAAISDNVDTLSTTLATNNTIAKANAALQPGANISSLNNDVGYITGGAFIPTSQRGTAGGVATLGADTKVPIAQLPTGTASTQVAAGNDSRFDTVRTGAPSGNPAAGRVFIWIAD